MQTSPSRLCGLLFLLGMATLSSLLAHAGGVGVSTEREQTTQQGSGIPFNPYQVPVDVSRRARRDLEFLWSQTYQDSFGRPLDALYGGQTDLARLGRTICDDPGTNPFLFEYTDIQLIFDYLNRRYEGTVYRDSIYEDDEFAAIGFKVNQSNYPDDDRKHVDTYIYAPKFQNDGAFGSYAGDAGSNYGKHPSDFTDNATEDLSTGRTGAAVLPLNSLMIPGPRPSQVGDLNDATRWTGPDMPKSGSFNHEFQHTINHADPSTGLSEIFSSAAEALAGVKPDRPAFDVPYTWNLTRWNFSLTLHNYAAWRSFSAYVTFNFRGVDTTVAGANDDLLWRWAMGPTRHLTDLIRRLSPAECVECTTKTYFNNLSPTDRFHLLLHNWRVANFVNNVAFADSQYGFQPPPQLGFDPFSDVGNWQDVDGVVPPNANDTVNIALEVTLGPAQFQRDVSQAGHATPQNLNNAHVMSLEPFGSDYWVVRSDPALASAGRDLVIRVLPDGCSFPAGTRLMASAIGYSEQNLPGDSLWKHSEWAQTVIAPKWVDIAQPGAGAIELVVPSFGQTNKAALVVITSSNNADDYTASYILPYRMNLALRGTVFQSPNPLTVHGEPSVDSQPTWAPAGDELAFLADGHLYRRLLNGNPPTELVSPPQTQQQFRPDWSPLGDWVAFDQESTENNCNLLIYNTLTGELRRLAASPVHEHSPAFSPDGQQLAYLRFDPVAPVTSQVRRINLDGSGDVVLVSRGGFVQSPRWSPDGQHVYFSINDSLYAVSMSGQVIPRANLVPKVKTFDLAPGDGRLLVQDIWCANRSRMVLRDTLLSQSEVMFSQNGTQFFEGPRWSFDGTKLAFATDQGVTGAGDVFAGQVTYNRPPVLSQVGGLSINDATPVIDTVAYLGFPLDLVVDASDPDSDPLTYLAYFLRPELGMDFNPATQTFSWIPNLQTDLSVIYHVRFQVTTPSGGTDYAIARIHVAGGGGGCPYVDTRSAQGWQKENSILGRSLTGALATDTYRLKATPQAHDGRYYLRIRENEQERTTLDQVRLLAVDHGPGVRAFATPQGLVLGERRAAHRVTTATGVDVTHLVNGSGPMFQGQRGDMLLVQMTAPGELGSGLREGRGGPELFEFPCCEKQGPQPGGGFRAESRLPAAIDAAILTQSGILVQVRDESGGWRTIQHLYARASADEALVDSTGSGQMRLVFVGPHRLRFIGRVVPVGAAEAHELPLLAARHSQLGDAVRALAHSGGEAAVLDPGDTLALEFRAAPVAAGQARDFFLTSRGVYTAWRPADEPEGVGSPLPRQFALLQNQPNPFAHTTTIRFALPVTARVTLEVFDLLGRRVAALAAGEYPAGTHAVEWNRRAVTGAAAPPGVYLYRLNAGSYREQKKMVLLP